MVSDSMRLENGRFTVSAPWKIDPSKLPNNRSQVLSLAMKLRSRFLKDPELGSEYANAMNKFISRGFYEVSPMYSNVSKPHHFIPHHPVFHEHKSM